jgi:hypothetical protein
MPGMLAIRPCQKWKEKTGGGSRVCKLVQRLQFNVNQFNLRPTWINSTWEMMSKPSIQLNAEAKLMELN